jgi:hypothetical protein
MIVNLLLNKIIPTGIIEEFKWAEGNKIGD